MAKQTSGKMGAGTSKSQKGPNETNVDQEDYPFKRRRQAVENLRSVIKGVDQATSLDDWHELFATEVDKVRVLLLINQAAQQTGDTSLLVDKTSLDIVTLLESTVVNKPAEWKRECEVLCQVLASHISPPHIPGKIPDTKIKTMTVLNLVNIRIKTQKGIDGLLMVLQNNVNLEKIELGYTGITSQTYQQAHPHIAKLLKLTYLGLRGNRLENSVVTLITKTLQNKKTLPKLLWVDFANNIDIVNIPAELLNLLKQRWPEDHYSPTFRDLLDSKIVVHNTLFTFNL